MRPRELHREYYRDRHSERDLCTDFPGDEILIDGLRAMQVHFWNNNVNIDIPVLRVMNTVHYIVAYMFTTSCSGDPIEYEIMAYDSLSRDKQLTIVTMIVLAAMLKRTGGYRAQHCRNLILENRNQDFEEGVTLYDQFLRNAEHRFSEEDFLIDVPAVIEQMKEKDEIINQQAQKIQQLQYTITTMKEKEHKIENHFHGPYINENHVHERGTQILSAENVYLPGNEKIDIGLPSETPTINPSLFCRITQAAYDKGKAQQVEDELHSACVSAPKLVKAIRTNEALGYLDTQNLSSVELYNLLNEHFGLTFRVRTFQDYRSK